MITTNNPAEDLVTRLLEKNAPFAMHRHEDNPDDVVVLEGEIDSRRNLDDIPRAPDTSTASIVPFSQIREREFQVNDSEEAPIQCLKVTHSTRLSLHDVLSALPAVPIERKGDIQADVSDDQFSQMTEAIIRDEIGCGEASNVVVPRTAEADIVNFNREKALSIFRSLLGETGSYMTFAFSDGENYLIGASPERHLSVKDGKVGMTPISGTFRKPDGRFDREGLVQFLRNPKEQHELFMVLDEELKMMAKMCTRGGRVTGPFLREMRKLFHTEYQLEGLSDLDIIDLFRMSMFAPTIVGGPIENACNINQKYDKNDRRYYGGAYMVIDADEEGSDHLDSAIAIRTMEISKDGHVAVKAGATIVQDSDPESETKETTAKAAGALHGLSQPYSSYEKQIESLEEDEELMEALRERNALLSQYFFQNLEDVDLTVDALKNKTITIVASDDNFVHILAHMCMRMGAIVSVVHYSEYDSSNSTDLVIVGPGTGDPRDQQSEKMNTYVDIVSSLEKGDTPFLAVCLGHQVLGRVLGLPVEQKKEPTQGIANEIDFFGETQRVGFYNTFAVTEQRDRDDVEFSSDADSKEVHAMRGRNFSSFQFHPESILSQNGFEILRNELSSLVGKSTPDVFQAEKPVFLAEDEDKGFYRMITNRALCSEEERNSCCAIPNLLPVYEYLRSITIGSQGKSFCPFTHHLEKTNGYYLSVCEQLPSEISLDSVLQLLEDQFQKVQSKHCNRNDGYPYVTIGTAFTHEQALNSQFFDELEQYRQLHRLELMKRGIAIAIAHPLHPLGVNNNGTGRQHMVNQSLFRSQIPCILLRLFHPNDAVFMKEKEEEIPAFREFLSKFFPNKET